MVVIRIKVVPRYSKKYHRLGELPRKLLLMNFLPLDNETDRKVYQETSANQCPINNINTPINPIASPLMISPFPIVNHQMNIAGFKIVNTNPS